MDITQINKVVVGEAVKAPIPADAIPQERFTGDVLKGRGPRRGSLERLLRYWRPIMRREGGFRRCRVILANHPELFPLNNICAWLHHETTGLWPNEGCHHPGMKNCRKKIRGVVNGSLISNDDFEARIRRLGSGKSAMGEMQSPQGVITEDDILHAMRVLRDFIEMESDFAEFLRDQENWEYEGQDDEDNWVEYKPMSRDDEDDESQKDCGCD